jgi:hypothetical protein
MLPNHAILELHVYFLLILLITQVCFEILAHNESVDENNTGYNYHSW